MSRSKRSKPKQHTRQNTYGLQFYQPMIYHKVKVSAQEYGIVHKLRQPVKGKGASAKVEAPIESGQNPCLTIVACSPDMILSISSEKK